jgi:hypothetical protein
LTPGRWLLRAQNAQIWAASALIGLEPSPRRTAVTCALPADQGQSLNVIRSQAGLRPDRRLFAFAGVIGHWVICAQILLL